MTSPGILNRYESPRQTQLRFGPYVILALTDQTVNCHIALKAMYCVLIILLVYMYNIPHSSVEFVKYLENMFYRGVASNTNSRDKDSSLKEYVKWNKTR